MSLSPRLLLGLLPFLTAVEAGGVALEPCLLRAESGGPATEARCGHLAVPLDPEIPEGDTLELRIAVVPAPGEKRSRDAVTILAGGPGGSATSFYASFSAAFNVLGRRHDIVLVDQRGTGASLALDCPAPEDLLAVPEPQAMRADAESCLAGLPADPRLFTTSVAVRDLDKVRATLGYERLHLYGASYGTRVAQHYLRRFPTRTGVVILDGVVPAGRPLGPRLAINAQSALDAMLADCAGDPDCGARFPDLAGRLATYLETLSVEPIPLEVVHPTSGELVDYQLGPMEMATALRLLSYAPESRALLPLLIDEALRGRPAPLALQSLMAAESLANLLSIGMHNAVVCTEDVPHVKPTDVDRERLASTYAGALQYDALVAICEVWPAGRLDADLMSPVESAHPVLLLSGEFDPVTPPAWGDEAMAGLSNARHVVVSGQGHGVAVRGCLPRVLAGLLLSEDIAALDVTCAERLRAAPFFLDYAGPAP